MFDDISDLSSELSSPPTSPIAPPDFYPTPTPSQAFDSPDVAPAADRDDMPPAKKRRKIEPKPRTTQHLDLRAASPHHASDQAEQFDLLLKLLRKRRKIVVIAGAGISVSAGIPDFRSSHGLFTTLRSELKLKTSGKHLFDASVYKNDSSTSSFHDMVRSLSDMASTAKPTRFHHLIARLAHEDRLLRLYTQNVDGIETSMPPLATQVPLNHKGPWPRTVQLHGGLEKMICQKCRHTSDFRPELFQGPDPPLCPECLEKDAVRTTHAGKRSHGIGKLRPRIVLYNEHNPDEEAIGAVVTSDLRSRPDAVIVVGTTLKIPGVKRIVREMCGVARGRKNGLTMWVNRDPVPVGKEWEDCFDLVVRGDCDDVARLTGFKDWDDENIDAVDECTASDVERVKQQQGGVEVVVRTPKKKSLLNLSGMMTPPVSQDELTDSTDGRFPLKMKKIRNPASQGKSLTDVLGKDEKATVNVARKTSSKPKKAPKERKQPSLTITGRVTKGPAQPTGVSDVKRTTKPHPGPMAAISPQAARNNASLFPNLPPYPKVEPSPPESPTTAMWKDRRTVSPTGSVPADMVRLLN